MAASIDPLGAANDAAGWIERILARRHGKHVALAANTLYHAGMIMVELRSLRDRMETLLRPLTAFNPADWPPERRATWIGDLREFAEGLPQFGRIDQHAMTLRKLPTPEDVTASRDGIVELALAVTHLGDVALEGSSHLNLHWDDDVSPYYSMGLQEEGRTSLDDGPDLIIRYYLPALLWLVRHADAEHPEQVETLRALAAGLRTTRSERGDEPLKNVVHDVELKFAELNADIVRKYPEIPAPTWAGA